MEIRYQILLFSVATRTAGAYFGERSLGLPVPAPWKTAVECFIGSSFSTFTFKRLSKIKGNSSKNYLLMAASVFGGALAWNTKCLIVKNSVGVVARLAFRWKFF